MTAIKTQSKQYELRNKLLEVKKNTKASQNLLPGVEVCCYPLNCDAPTEMETLTVFNYEELQALKDLVSCGGLWDVEVQYLGMGTPETEYKIFGIATDLIETTIELATKFPEVDLSLISFLMDDSAGDVQSVIEALEQWDDIVWDVYPTNSCKDAFIEFITDHAYIDVPSDLITYIDFGKMMNDFVEITALQIQHNKTFIIDTSTAYK